MKLNAKDLAAGLFLLFVAVAGLYLNLDHSLGSARRMGPGYMPMLVFGLLVFLSAMVLLASFFNGPAGGAYDLGTKPRSRAAYRRSIVPLSG